MHEGLVIRAQSSFFEVSSSGESTRLCRARGVFKKQGVRILVGDRVMFNPIGQQEGIIQEVMPRDTFLVRPPIANISQVLIVFSIVTPDLNRNLLDKMLVSAEHARIPSVIILTKCDLASEADIESVRSIYTAAGYTVLSVATKKGYGVDSVLAVLKGNVTVFAGPSGAGKSTLANAISPELGLRMGAISDKAGLGKHTTRHVELFHVAGETWVADAPGFSQLDVQIPSTELRDYFPEFARVNECPYRGCAHIDEQDCRVKEAVFANLIDKDRFNSYRLMFEAIREREVHKY
jgi:ribosome biogenesis GTPase / thiamine phosphate phosphatase